VLVVEEGAEETRRIRDVRHKRRFENAK